MRLGMNIHFNIIVVSYNPGNRLRQTLESIYEQDYWDYDVVIEDSESDDGSLRVLRDEGFFEAPHVKERTDIYIEKDKGIYDGMNRAIKRLREEKDDKKDFVFFLNCGDLLRDRQVLGAVADHIEQSIDISKDRPYIFYGDQYNLLMDTRVSSAPKINEFAMFRNVPNHQVCFYERRLFSQRGYDTSYRVRADYEHFLWCMYEQNTIASHMDILISGYEGGGYSETENGRKISATEHREITDRYMGSKAALYRAIMIMTGAPIRRKIAEGSRFSGIYNRLKSMIYKRRS